MKKSFMSMMVALFVLLVSSSFAQAAANPYVSLSAGLGLMSNTDVEENGTEFEDVLEYSAGYVVNAAVGLDADMFRLEGAVGYQVNDVDKFDGMEVPDGIDAELSILSFMANGYVDFESEASSITPYVMAGLGVGIVDLEVEGELDGADSETVFAWQLGAGVGIQATENVIVDLGYRYFATGDIADEDDFDVNLGSHNLMAGVRFGF